MKNRRKIIFIDVDGTLINFRNMDKHIISKIYHDSKLVKVIDKILWWFNDFDIVGYSNFIFYFRIFLYSILSGNNVKVSLKKYEKLYSKYAQKQITEKLKEALIDLEKLNYQVCIVTRNMYASCLSKTLNKPIHIVKNKRKFYSSFYCNYNILHIIGNNYMDDIVSCYLLNGLYKKHEIKNKVVPIYIGKSKIVKWIVDKNTICFDNLKSCIRYLKNVVD